MKLYEMPFTAYYHQFVLIEADDLTEECAEKVNVTEDDCYALCSSYCAEDGLLMFNVLSIGTKENYGKGLQLPEMLAYYPMDLICDKEAEIVEADFSMIEKNHPFMQRMDAMTDEDVQMTRWDERLDMLRDMFYPDSVLTGIVADQILMEYDMVITGTEGPFLKGSLAEEPEEDLGLHIGDRILALPYVSGDEVRLFALFAGDHLTREEEAARQQIIDKMTSLGFDFYGYSLKN